MTPKPVTGSPNGSFGIRFCWALPIVRSPGSFHTRHRVNRMETKKESPSSANCVGNRYILCRPDLWRSLLTNGSLCFGNTPSPKKRKRKRNCTPITGNSPEKPEACLSNT